MTATDDFATISADTVRVGDVVLGWMYGDQFRVMRGGPFKVGVCEVRERDVRIGPEKPSNRAARFFGRTETLRIARRIEAAERQLRDASAELTRIEAKANRMRREADEMSQPASDALDRAVDAYRAAGGTEWLAVMRQGRETAHTE